MDKIGSDSTPEIDRAVEDVEDIEDAGYPTDSVDQQVQANEDATEDWLRSGGDDKPTGEA